MSIEKAIQTKFELRFYCRACEELVPVIAEPMRQDELNPRPWGDIVCAQCKGIIATMSTNAPGRIGFVFLPQDDGETLLSQLSQRSPVEKKRLYEGDWGEQS